MKTKLYYGWVITLTLAVTETISWGVIYYAFTVFITPMEAELGWSRGMLTGAFSLFLLVSGGMAYLVGSWIDRHGGRLLMTVGSVGASLLVIAWSQVSDPLLFYLIWIGLGVCAAATLYEPAFAVVTVWFERGRTNALALITFAAGFASSIFVPLSDWLLNQHGWRTSVLILGIVLALTTILPHALVLRRRPQDLGLLPDGERIAPDAPPAAVVSGMVVGEVLRGKVFWVIAGSFLLSTLAAQAIRVHIIPYLMEAGISATSAALASGAIGTMQVAGRLVFAPLDRRFSGRVMVFGVMALQVVAMLLLLGDAASPVVLWLFVMVFGAAYGAKTLARASIIGREFGAMHYGRISSVMSMVLTLAWTFAPVGAGWLHDVTGSYDLLVWVMIGLSLASVGVLALLRQRPADRLVTDRSAA